MAVPTPHDIHASITAAFGPAIDRQVHTFSSGAVSITLRAQGRTAVIDGTPSGEWGVSIDPDEATAMAGHDTVTDSFSTALDIARNALLAP